MFIPLARARGFLSYWAGKAVSLGHAVRLYDTTMNIPEHFVTQFAETYQQEYGEELTPEDAKFLLFRLMNLYLELSRPLPSSVGSENSPENHRSSS